MSAAANTFTSRFLSSARNAWVNYPVTMLATLVTAVMAIVVVETPYSTENNAGFWALQAFNAWSAVPLSLAVTLWVRHNSKPQSWLYIGLAISVLIPFLLAFWLDINKVSQLNVYPVHVNIIGHLLVALSCYHKPADEGKFWAFNMGLFLQFIWASLMAFVLNSGISLAVIAVKALFDLDLGSKLFSYIGVFAAFIFQPHFFLGNLNQDWLNGIDQSPTEGRQYPKYLRILVQFILLPIISLYILILYAYGIKALFVETPKGYLSYLILALGFVGILTLLIGYPLRKLAAESWFRTWDKLYYYLMVPILALMVWAAWLRIAPYGLTTPRLLLVYTMIWLTLVVGYMITSRKWGIRFIPLTLAFFVALAMAGPASVYSLAVYHQQHLATEILDRYKLNPGDDASKLKREDKHQLASALKYLADAEVAEVGGRTFNLKVDKKKDKFKPKSEVMLAQLHLTTEDAMEYLRDSSAIGKNANLNQEKVEINFGLNVTDSAFTPVPANAVGYKYFVDSYLQLEPKEPINFFVTDALNLTTEPDSSEKIIYTLTNAQLKLLDKGRKSKEAFILPLDKLSFRFQHEGQTYCFVLHELKITSQYNRIASYSGHIYQLKSQP